jgi:hypothetical protein
MGHIYIIYNEQVYANLSIILSIFNFNNSILSYFVISTNETKFICSYNDLQSSNVQ